MHLVRATGVIAVLLSAAGCNLFQAGDYAVDMGADGSDMASGPDASDDVGVRDDDSGDSDVSLPDMTSCTDDCECPPGEAPDGMGACADIDECADGTHDCDANASCTNEPGSFQCDCDPPYVGDGRSCMLPPPALVASVHHVTIDLSQTTASAALPAEISDAEKTVPFATAVVTATSGDLEATIVDVWVDPQAGTVEVARGAATGSVEVEVTLVEFDQANIQTGTFEMLNTVSDDVTLPTAFDASKSFVVFGSVVTNLAVNDYNQSMAALDYDGTTLAFSRKIGFGSTLTGHWYAVEAAEDEFSVVTDQMEIAFGDRCVSTMSTADFSRTMLIAIGGSPAKQNAPLEDPSMSNIACGPSGGSIECCRGEPDPDTNAVSITLFSVMFDPGSNGSVEHHQIAIPIGDTEQEQALDTAIDPGWSMASIGRTGVTGAVLVDEETAVASQHAAFGAATLAQDGAAVRVEIGVATTSLVEAWVQAVSWPH